MSRMLFCVTPVRVALLAGVKANDLKPLSAPCLSRDCMRPHKAPDQPAAVSKAVKAAPKESTDASGARPMPCQRTSQRQPYSLTDQSLTYSPEKTNYLYDQPLIASENWSLHTKRKNGQLAKIGEDPIESCIALDDVMNGSHTAKKEVKKLELVFLKFIGSRAKTIAIDIQTARSEHALKCLINEHLRGKEFSPNAVIEVHRNGLTLRNYEDVQHGETLQLSLVRHGLCGGMKDRIHPEQIELELQPLNQGQVEENFEQNELIEENKLDSNMIKGLTADQKEQVKNKLQRNNMFASLVTSMGEEVFWPKFLQVLSEEDAEKIMNRSNDHFQMGHNPDDIEERMNFFNDLPDWNRKQFLGGIEDQIENTKQQEESKDISEIQEESKGNQEQQENLMNHKIVQMIYQLSTEERKRLLHFLRTIYSKNLEIESEEYKWYHEITKQIPIPTIKLKEREEYDHKQMLQLLTTQTLRRLYDKKFYTCSEIKHIQETFESEPLKVLFIDLYFTDGKDEIEVTDQEVLSLMKEKAIPYLRNQPKVLRMIKKRIIDPNFFRRVGNDLIKVIMDQANKALYQEGSRSDFFDENFKVFNKQTKQKFCSNLMKETKILQRDFTDAENIFPADMLLQMERANSVEFYIGYDNNDWIVDYPILCYKKKEEQQLVMVHLADLDAQERIYKIPSGESFLAFIEPNNRQAKKNVLIQLLEQNEKEEYIIRTISYARPFEKKEDFSYSANWQEEISSVFPANNDLKKKLLGVREVHLVERKDEYEQKKFGLIIQKEESVFLYDMEGSKGCEKLCQDGCLVMNTVQRGVDDQIYIATNEEEKGKLQAFDIALNQDATLEVKMKQLIFEGQKIKAFVMETTLATDEKSSSDQIYVLLDNKQMSLNKIEVSKKEKPVTQLLSLIQKVFPIIDHYCSHIANISVSGNYLMFCDQILNYKTGCSFNAGSYFQKSVPFTNMYIGKEDYHGSKNQIRTKPGSRERITFAQRQEHVRKFELLNSELILAELECQSSPEDAKTTYWTLMDTHGRIKKLPDVMKQILEMRRWVKSLSKAVTIDSQDQNSETQEKSLIVLLSNHKKSNGDNSQSSVFPDIAAILLDKNGKNVCSKMFITGETIMKEQNLNQNIKPYEHFKPLITEKAEIILIYAYQTKEAREKEKEVIESKHETKSEISLKTLAIHENYYVQLRWPALYVNEQIYFGDEDGMQFITKECYSNDDAKPISDENYAWIVQDLDRMDFGNSYSILSHQSKFYRQRPSEAIIDSSFNQLDYKHKLQFKHRDEATTCELDKLQNILTQEGEYDNISHTDQLLDPEKYVDTDIQLSKLYKQEHPYYIWSHVNANVTPDLIHMYRDNIYEPEPCYSFHGLYQKYSHADLLELTDFLKGKKQKEHEIDMSNLIASFYGNSIIEILFSNHKMLQLISNKLYVDDFPREEIMSAGQKKEIENIDLRRLYQVLSVHEIGASRTSEESTIQCNSLLYKGMHSKQRRNYDALLKIVSKCDEFSLQNFIIAANDLEQVMTKPSQQIIQALNEILIATSYTQEIKELQINFQSMGFWDKRFKLDVGHCQNKVLEQLEEEQNTELDLIQKTKSYFFNFDENDSAEESDEIDEEIDEFGTILNPVQVTVLKVNRNQQQSEFNARFLDILKESSDEDFDSLMETLFVKAMFYDNWNYYEGQIIRRFFLPYVFYMISVLCFLTFTLVEDISDREINGCVFHMTYYPLLVCCIGFSIKQIDSEKKQFKQSATLSEYLSLWNIVDLICITLNIVIMLLNFLDVTMISNLENKITLFTLSWFVVDHDKGTISVQRKLAAVSASLLWFRLYDWFRLFKPTAFYLILIKNTIQDSLVFIAIICISFMGFGTFVYFLNMDQEPGDELMTSRFGFPFLDIFQYQYEFTLGEFSLEHEQPIIKEIMTFIFTAATFFFIIVLFNMLIAIMGDTHSMTSDQRVENRQREMSVLMSEYMKVVDKEVQEEKAQEKKQEQEDQDEESDVEEKYDMNTQNYNYFYVINSLAEKQIQTEDAWDGSVKTIKNFIEHDIKRHIIKKMDEQQAKNSKNLQEQKDEVQKNQEIMQKNQDEMKENQKEMKRNQENMMAILLELKNNQLLQDKKMMKHEQKEEQPEEQKKQRQSEQSDPKPKQRVETPDLPDDLTARR